MAQTLDDLELMLAMIYARHEKCPKIYICHPKFRRSPRSESDDTTGRANVTVRGRANRQSASVKTEKNVAFAGLVMNLSGRDQMCSMTHESVALYPAVHNG